MAYQTFTHQIWWVMVCYDLAHQVRCAKHTFSGWCDIPPMVCCSFGGHSTPQFLQCIPGWNMDNLTEAKPIHPSPQDFAWTKDQAATLWVPVWTTIPVVSKACHELIRCSCRGDCRNCKCGRANLICSPLCKCKCNQTLPNTSE